jgi:hypothetical protein
VAGGEEKAFALIVDRYWQKIYALAMDFLKSAPDAEDIVQEVFMKVWVKREGLAMIERFLTFYCGPQPDHQPAAQEVPAAPVRRTVSGILYRL